MAFRDLDEFLHVEPLVLPIRGKEYRFPGEISARSWLALQRIGERQQRAIQAKARGEKLDPDEVVISDYDEAALMAEMYGGLDEQMAADGLSNVHMKLVFQTLMIFHLNSREAAEAFWNGLGEAPAPNRATRRHPPTSTR